MKFTKEQIETAKELLKTYRNDSNVSVGFDGYLDSLLKPERKKIIVEIEYDKIKGSFGRDLDITKINVENTMKKEFISDFNFKITELPEVFTRENMIEFAEYYSDDTEWNFNHSFDHWLSERNYK